jgi:arsenate reductase
LIRLGLKPGNVLRKRDPSYKQLGLTGSEPDDLLISHLVQNPTLLDRPIGVLDTKAVVGRPPEKLLELVK